MIWKSTAIKTHRRKGRIRKGNKQYILSFTNKYQGSDRGKIRKYAVKSDETSSF